MVARVLFPWLTSWMNMIPSPPAGDHQGPPRPSSTALAPTARLASCLTSRLRSMRIGRNELRPIDIKLRKDELKKRRWTKRVTIRHHIKNKSET